MAKQKPQRTTYEVLVAFPYQGGWTTKGQEVDLLPVEARALLRAERIRAKTTTQAVAKPAAKQKAQ
jgi:hypothetical protein|tara:strand:+ start:295 stop:492 length:198 start_codon:yes stop_codon:yes gene_type:complete